MSDERSLVEKLLAMAAQDVSPRERDIARAKLEELGQRADTRAEVLAALRREVEPASPDQVRVYADEFGWGLSVAVAADPHSIELGVGALLAEARARIRASRSRLEGVEHG